MAKIRRRGGPDIGRQLFAQLERLAAMPQLARHLAEGPLRCRRAYTLEVGRPPLGFVFTVLFQFDADEQHIEITDFGALSGDPPELVEP
jgi:hypothetical protein